MSWPSFIASIGAGSAARVDRDREAYRVRISGALNQSEFSSMIARTDKRPVTAEINNGAVAQLGERMNGIHEVRGSIPLGSTKF